MDGARLSCGSGFAEGVVPADTCVLGHARRAHAMSSLIVPSLVPVRRALSSDPQFANGEQGLREAKGLATGPLVGDRQGWTRHQATGAEDPGPSPPRTVLHWPKEDLSACDRASKERS